MSNMIQSAKDQVASLTQAAYEKAAAEGLLPAGAQVKATIEIPKDVSHGDYASSFAMAGAKALHMAPRAIAQIILDHLELEGTYFQSAEIAGPGFLNFRLGSRWYGEVIADIEREGMTYGTVDEGHGELVDLVAGVVDVELTPHVVAGTLQHTGQAVTQHAATGVADVHGAGGGGGDELYQHLLPRAVLGAPVIRRPPPEERSDFFKPRAAWIRPRPGGRKSVRRDGR